MILYLVYGDTWPNSYGSYINIFGAFTSREKAEEIRNQAQHAYNKIGNGKYFDILEIKVDTAIDEFLGGYCE